MTRGVPFHSIYAHDFVRVAVAVPEVALANPAANLRQTLALARRAAQQQAVLVVFPELGLTGYSLDDLFQQEVVLGRAADALLELRSASTDLDPVLVVGLPWRCQGRLFNCAAVVHRGRILGLIPKTYLPNYREFYEKRQFCPAAAAPAAAVEIEGERVPFGNHLLFRAVTVPHFAFAVEICEDLWSPIPPSTFAALAGATVLVNLSASNITIGKAEYRRALAASQSGRCLAGYLYAAAGFGESTTDLAWDGHGMIFENGRLVAETTRFAPQAELALADLDLGRLVQERLRVTSFADTAVAHQSQVGCVQEVAFELALPRGRVPLLRPPERFPYVPSDPAQRHRRCEEAYHIQVTGLQRRLCSTGYDTLVVGVSGGLDSTQALLVAAKTMDRMGLPRSQIRGYTMPGFATSRRTHHNALALMKALGVHAEEIDIRPACRQMLKDLRHPFAQGQPVYDLTFENVQAGERTSHLFRLANQHRALVLGTGDLSELALGWCTYGVGDHMSHYNVNASVPKTLIQHLIRWVLATGQCGEAAAPVLRSILDTEISPELVPGAGRRGRAGERQPAQSTESIIGPFDLQDFHTYYVTRFGFRPSKVAFLAHQAWGEASPSPWPDDLPAAHRHVYDLATIKKWLRVFLQRFFGSSSQFKRSCVPNGPKVGSGGSLSPRGDWRAPSDAEATAWLEELEENVPDR
ncbi:MAG: NAD synthetase [Candidatus Ozemobacter sibiricus]|uniref:Glutamine-dependent NAD(+) synthetase n=1 Tax=Candidatus Ozemobacter sibiricus TaxID=2268124 RepID=A0A367ZMP1_9BACT|nr:MAG: NAD synthetase [Candidatus Ozemobacter sibiricus]